MSDPITASEREAAITRDPLEASNINSNYAFLVHSQTTIPGNLPPNVDNKALARQKRRRTSERDTSLLTFSSPEDHVILETEYQRNPKPDKTARVDIVSRVALGEKEVQIWFQNRRQNDRRKSRPLQPHEVFTPFRAYSHMPPTTSEVIGNKSRRNPGDGALLRISSSDITPAVQRQSSTPLNDSSFQSTDESIMDQEAKQESGVDTAGIQTIYVREECPVSMRLSMSLDGNAQVTPNTDFQISPPKYRRNAAAFSLGRVGGLKRSQSAVTLGESGPSAISSLFSDFPKRSSLGRSRDSRTWQFYCDSDARDALTAQAERENSGSAAGAISLMRSRSNTAFHKPNSRVLQNPNSETSRDKTSSSRSRRKSKFSRATSSLGRLQSSKGNIESKDPNTAVQTSKLGMQERIVGSPTGDSDKENWLPGTYVSNTPRRQDPKGRPVKRPILHENRQILSHSSGLEVYLAADKRRASRKQRVLSEEDKENGVKEGGDEEAENFMREGPHSNGGEDFDCIQGLLSLSQGAWR